MRALIAVLLAFLALLPGSAAAQERIEDFHSRLELSETGLLHVTETIRVNAQGIEIRRGILRDVPTRYDGPNGSQIKVGFNFLGSELDGRTVPTKLERISNGVRLRIGDPETTVSPGSHVYRIRYTVRRATGFFNDYDELYWNAIPNDSIFTIDHASVTLVLPGNTPIGEVALYTGGQGSTERAARVVDKSPGVLKVETTKSLRAREGMTVAAAFPKGVIAPPSERELAARRIAQYAPHVAAVIGLLLVIAYYVWAWLRVGRDPKPGTIVPLFSPPGDMSPAAMRYVTKQGMDYRGFAAALVDAGVKGHVRLEETGGGFLSKGTTRIRRGDVGEGSELGEAEREMLTELAPPGGELEMKQENHAKFSAARKALDTYYSRIFVGKAFHRNIGWAVAGLLVLFLATALVAAGIVWAEDLASPALPLLSVAGLAVAALLLFGAPEKGHAGRWIVIGFGVLVALGAGAISLAMFPLVATGGGMPMMMLVLVPAALIVLSGFFWMDAPTADGRVLLDRIAGFKQYLSATEGERFDRMQPEDEDLKLFERFLPYAIALGVENKWAGRFEDRLARAAQDPGRDQGFTWYSGSRQPWDNPASFSKAVGASLASTVASASSAPGSSSGSGGGGFSGGGGGGGGVGGW